jgi:hypothetical protein
VWLIFSFLDVKALKQTFSIGTFWVSLSVIFEFSLGRLTNKSWEYLLQRYNIVAGQYKHAPFGSSAWLYREYHCPEIAEK